jgi:hypothetical protein
MPVHGAGCACRLGLRGGRPARLPAVGCRWSRQRARGDLSPAPARRADRSPPPLRSRQRAPARGLQREGSVGLGVALPAQAAALGAGLGSSLVRVALNWAFTQARAGSPYDWRKWDERYRAYTALGIRPIWAIQASPRWAVDPGVASEACPVKLLRLLQAGQECLTGPAAAHRADYAAFAATVARRYPLSAAVEIWNEPNLDYYWRNPDPVAYGALARQAIAAVRRAPEDACAGRRARHADQQLCCRARARRHDRCRRRPQLSSLPPAARRCALP